MSLSALAGLGTSPSPVSPAGASATDANGQDRFLKLLVAQMQNQDPLSPLDNAQVTSQMAQINAVTGIERVNGNLQAMLSQLVQSQALQGASLVGRDVLVEGNAMHLDASAEGRAAIELGARAERVTVEVLGRAGQVLDSFPMGALDPGRHHFAWRASDASLAGTPVSYRVTATAGTAAVPATSYTRETVGAVAAGASGIDLDLASGRTLSYSKVRSIV